jgi:hypothetical protein
MSLAVIQATPYAPLFEPRVTILAHFALLELTSTLGLIRKGLRFVT